MGVEGGGGLDEKLRVGDGSGKIPVFFPESMLHTPPPPETHTRVTHTE